MKLEAKKYLFDMMKPQSRLQPANPKRWSSKETTGTRRSRWL